MASFTEVFERKEIKYRLSAAQQRAVVASLAGRMRPDDFGTVKVLSIYFDTPDRALIDRSLEKPLYKEKLRLRSYGAPQEDDRVYIEIKKKYKGIVYKRRVGLSYAAARAYFGGVPYEDACTLYPLADPLMEAESVSPRSLQIAREIDRFLVKHQPLRASMIIACNRTAYVPSGACSASDVPEGLRITFDSKVSYRDLFAEQGNKSDLAGQLLRPGEAIMEIKSAGPLPLWLVRALDAARVYPTSFSKYGEAYRACAAQATPAHAERLVPVSRDVRVRQFRAPQNATKKGGRCA